MSLRALIVGLGSIGRRHARNWAALGLGPIDVCRQLGSPQPEPPGVAAREFHVLAEALEERPDVVVVTNPTSLHLETACQAVRAGAHVFVEKPLSHELSGVASFLEAVRQAQRQVMVGYNLRFHPGLVRLRELVHQGTIGKAVAARAEVGEYLPEWHPWEDYRRSYSGRRTLGGGAVLTLSHELDALCWVLGAPSQVMAMTTHASSLEIDTEDVAELTLQFPGGTLASVHMDYVRRPTHRSLEIIGEDGTLRWEYESHRLLEYTPANRQWRVEELDPAFERNDTYVAELRHFASSINGEIERPLVDGQQGAAILAVALAALRSAREGHMVDLHTEGELVETWLSSLGRR